MKAKFDGDDSVDAQLADHETRIAANEGKLAGITTTVTAAIEASASATETAYKAYADQAEADAIAAAETASENKVKVERERIDTLASEKTRLEGLIGENAEAISDVEEAYAAADDAR